jgi:hypothetical protein
MILNGVLTLNYHHASLNHLISSDWKQQNHGSIQLAAPSVYCCKTCQKLPTGFRFLIAYVINTSKTLNQLPLHHLTKYFILFFNFWFIIDDGLCFFLICFCIDYHSLFNRIFINQIAS